MHNQHLLPTSNYIDTTTGLQYLNNNRELYLKILNRFLTRYRDFDINNSKEDDFKNEMHTLKGLSSTLGMNHLSELSKKLYEEQSEELCNEFTKTLDSIISTLHSIQSKTILILTDNHNEIETLLEVLEDKYDIILSITIQEALETMEKENIDIMLLNPTLTSYQIENRLKQKSINSIQIPQPINANTLQIAMKSI